jgi:hypothetical protein
MHAVAKERLDQACSLDAFENSRLQRGPTRLVMRCLSAFDDSRHDAMTHELASREQPGRAGPHDQDGRDGFTCFTGIQIALLLTIGARARMLSHACPSPT